MKYDVIIFFYVPDIIHGNDITRIIKFGNEITIIDVGGIVVMMKGNGDGPLVLL